MLTTYVGALVKDNSKLRTTLRFEQALLKQFLPWLVALVVLIAIVWLTYSPYQRDLYQPQADSNVGPLMQGRILTQEFRANVDNLSRIDLLIGTYARQNRSSLIFELVSIPAQDASNRAGLIRASGLSDNSYYQWRFDPLADSAGRKFLLSIWSPDASTDDSVTLWTSLANVYPEGTTAINGTATPLESITFSTYSFVAFEQLLVRTLAAVVPRHGGHLGIVAALLGPGFILWSLSRRRANILHDLALVMALSLSVSLVLLLWGILTPARAVTFYWWAGVILLAVGVLVVFLRTIRDGVVGTWWPLLTAATAILTAGTRLALYGGQQYPLWGDSVQHATAAELFRREAGLPASWDPIALLDSFTYHFGFHVWAGDLAHSLDLTSRSAVVTFGFVLLGLTSWSSAYLAERLSGRPIAGPVAALLTGFVMPFPSFLLNWGRYPQLFSLILLAVLAALLVEDVTKRVSLRQVPVYALLFVGILVSHYRSALLAATFVLALLLVMLVRRIYGYQLLAGIGLAVVLALPWLIRLLDQPPLPRSAVPVTAEWPAIYNAVGDLVFFTPALVLVAAGVGLIVIAGLGHFARVLVVLVWVGLSWALASVSFPGWPAGSLINHFFVESSAYLIVTPLAAVALAWMGEIGFVLISRATAGPNMPLASRRAKWGRPFTAAKELPGLVLRPSVVPTMVAIILGLALGLSTNEVAAPDLRHRLVYAQDVQAIQWLRETAGVNDKTLVMTELAMGGSTIVGTDAGWWLPLSGISTQLPPVTYLIEHPAPAQSEWLDMMVADHQLARPLDPDQWLEQDFRYLYVGVANRWAEVTTTRPIKLIYNRDEVRIYDLQ